jgi:hypothetical protein
MEAESKLMSERWPRETASELEYERPSGSSQFDVGGGDVQQQLRDAVREYPGNLRLPFAQALQTEVVREMVRYWRR